MPSLVVEPLGTPAFGAAGAPPRGERPRQAIRFNTLTAICRELDCKPGDVLDYVPEP